MREELPVRLMPATGGAMGVAAVAAVRREMRVARGRRELVGWFIPPRTAPKGARPDSLRLDAVLFGRGGGSTVGHGRGGLRLGLRYWRF